MHLPEAGTISHYANKFNTGPKNNRTHKKLVILNLLFVPTLVRLKIQMIDRSHFSFSLSGKTEAHPRSGQTFTKHQGLLF